MGAACCRRSCPSFPSTPCIHMRAQQQASPCEEGLLPLPWLPPAGTASATKLLPELEKDTLTVPSPLSVADTPVGADAELGEGLGEGLGVEDGELSTGGGESVLPGESLLPGKLMPPDPRPNCVSFRRAPMSTRPACGGAMEGAEHRCLAQGSYHEVQPRNGVQLGKMVTMCGVDARQTRHQCP